MIFNQVGLKNVAAVIRCRHPIKNFKRIYYYYFKGFLRFYVSGKCVFHSLENLFKPIYFLQSWQIFNIVNLESRALSTKKSQKIKNFLQINYIIAVFELLM
jgi:hypothetical protein